MKNKSCDIFRVIVISPTADEMQQAGFGVVLTKLVFSLIYIDVSL